MSRQMLGLFLCVWAAVLISDVGGFPLDKKAENVANALMYLNQLDQLYSNQIRPSNVAHLSKKAGHQLKLIGDSLSLRARPRFGKRGFGGNFLTSDSPQYYDQLNGMRINNAD